MTNPTSTRPLVVGFDGSPSSENAVRWAAVAAARSGTSLVVLHAADRIVYAQDEGYGIWDPATVQQASLELAEKGAQLAREEQPDLEVRARGSLLGPRQALDEASAGAQGVVVGARGLGRIRSTLLGATAYGITGHARCPVTVVPEHAGVPGSGAPIVVGVDGSAEAERAATVAATLAHTWGSDLVVVSSWEQPYPDPWGMSVGGFRSAGEAAEALEEQARSTAQQVADRVAQSHPEVAVSTATPMGRPDETLLDAAAEAGLLVLGTRGAGRLSSFLLGSTTRNILHLTTVAVHIVR